jgi:hypothetical protein
MSSLYTMPAPLEISVRYPKLFVGFLGKEPTFNTHYVKTRVESENTVCRYRFTP